VCVEAGAPSHLANALENIGAARKGANLLGRELQESRIFLLNRQLGFHDVDLLLGGNRSGFNLLNELQ
jgi:hypothetical protein